jgi:antitoxin VapB
MNIRSARVDQLAQRLARLTGEDVETALERALEERLSRVAPPAASDRRAALASFFERVSQMRVLDPRPADDILGYDDCGLPT